MKQAALSRPIQSAVPRTLIWCVLGLLVPRATLFGELTPFGIGLAACAGAANLPTLLCLTIGYLLGGGLSPWRYVATIGMVGGLRWVLDALPGRGRRWFVPPLVAFTACTATGFILLFGTGIDLYRAVLILAEGAVAAGSTLFFDTALDLWDKEDRYLPTAANQTAVVLTGAVAVTAVCTLQVGGFAPGRMAAAFLVLVLARSGREGGGSIAGCVLGGAMALAMPGQTSLAAALAFGGLMAGLFSRFGRIVETTLFLAATGVVLLGESDEAVLFYIYEILGACLLFAVLPREWDRRLCRLFLRSRDLPAVEGIRRMTTMQLRVACGALEEVAQTVEAVARRLSRHGVADMASLYRGCYAAVCAACPLRQLCWEQHREETQEGLEKLTPFLRQEGKVTADRMGGFLAGCRQKDRFAEHLSRGYTHYVAQEEAWRRLEEIQKAVEGQFAGTGTLLRGLAARLEDRHQVDIELSGRILTVCEDYGMTVQDALCTRDAAGRLTVDILTTAGGIPPGQRWHRQMEQVCGRGFAPATEAAWGKQTRVTLTEPPLFRVESGLAQRRCGQEKLCGDTARIEPLPKGTLAVLSDGMGSGSRAAVDSSMAVGLVTRLWRAGFPPAGILQTVNAALLVKCREEPLSTLDVAVIDTHTGRFDSYKAGAAATLLRSQGRISRLDRPGLPVGILPDPRFEQSHDRLVEGDLVLMVSDGALAAGTAAVEQAMQDFPEDGNLQDLCEAVCAIAQGEDPVCRDDITALALRLCKWEEEPSSEGSP